MADKKIDNAYTFSLDEIADRLKTDPKNGLSSDEVSTRVQHGKNKIITAKPSIWKLYLAPLFDVLIVVYLIMTGIMLVLSLFVEGIASKVTFWLIIISINMALAIFQQFRAQKKLSSLQDLSPPMTTVVRDGKAEAIKAEDIVVGDVVNLNIGDKIPADARIISSSSLSMNEASLTGESEPVSKYRDGSKELESHTPISDRKNMVYLGTFVQEGEASVIIVRIGNDTELGKIASAMSEMQTMEIPLRNKINTLGKWLSILMVSFLAILVIFTQVQRINSGATITFESFSFDLAQGIITAMAVMPINIPLLTTVVLITGVLNMAKNKVVIKDLSAVETLGRISVLCSDKTGTMTSSLMTAKLIYDTDNYYGICCREEMNSAISVVDEERVNEFMDSQYVNNTRVENIDSHSTLGLLLTSAILNNRATIRPKYELDGDRQIGWESEGNPTDAALLILAKTQGLEEEYVRERYTLEKSYPFNSSVKRMSGIFLDNKEKDRMLFLKGASEVVIPLCSKIGDESSAKTFTKKKKDEIMERINMFANEGYRVISVAYRSIEDMDILRNEDEKEERGMVESDLSYAGFAVIFDPPRVGVSEAVSDLKNAGIFPIMITGDAVQTAATIARQVNVLDKDEIVVSGKDIPHLSDEEFFKVAVFARVSPQDKEVIVSKYQARGDIIAMAGDGVNDALAITKADAGVAMGRTGTEVTKDAADIIITDDSYVSMVRGVEEGRNLFEKIRIMIFFYIAVNLAEAIMYFSTSFRLDFQILNNWQRVYIFGIIHALPVLAIIFGPPNKDIMKLKPRASENIMSRPLIAVMIIFSISLAISLLGVYFLYFNGVFSFNSFNEGGIYTEIILRTSTTGTGVLLPETYLQAKARTMVLTIIYLAESFLVLSVRRVNSNFKEGQRDMNRLVAIFVFAGIFMHLAIMYITPLQRGLSNIGVDLELIRLSLPDLVLAVFAGLLPVMVLEVFKYIKRRDNKEF